MREKKMEKEEKNLKGKSYKNPFNPCNLWS